MAQPQYSSNHVTNPQTGLLENPAYSNSFDSDRKKAFLDLFYENGLKLRRTCDQLGLSVDTIHKHYNIDPKFKELYDDVEARYIDELEGISRLNALNPRSVIERIFQLKCLLPEKYGQENRPANLNITLNIDDKTLKEMGKRSQIIDAKEITDDQESNGFIVGEIGDRT